MLTFCLRDDDTNFFTNPDQLEDCYSSLWSYGPISLAVVPFQRGCQTQAIPEQFRNTGEIYPLADNWELVTYLRQQLHQGRIEIMLHGYHHEHFQESPEFCRSPDLVAKVQNGKFYLERLLETKVRVFIPPHNAISRKGWRAVAEAGLHLGSLPGLRLAWPLTSWVSWRNWWRVKRWETATGFSYPFVVDFGDHREIRSLSVTPSSDPERLKRELEHAAKYHGVFCLATHYWEFEVPHKILSGLSVRQQIYDLIDLAITFPSTVWVSVGECLNKMLG